MNTLMNNLLISADPVILSKTTIPKRQSKPLPKDVIALLILPHTQSHCNSQSENEISSAEDDSDC